MMPVRANDAGARRREADARGSERVGGSGEPSSRSIGLTQTFAALSSRSRRRAFAMRSVERMMSHRPRLEARYVLR